MKRLNHILLLCWLLLAAVACSEAGIDESAAIQVDRSSISTNKRGLTYEGGTVSFEVNSNVYWLINLDEGVDWLTLSPRAGSGSQIVRVTVANNPGQARTTVLKFDSYDGVTAEITIRQGSASELIYYSRTAFGQKAVAEPVAVAEFKEYGFEGIGTSAVKVAGESTYVATPSTPSNYEDASGGNAVHFAPEAVRSQTPPASISFGAIDQKGDSYFACKFGILNANGTIDPAQVKLEISNDNAEYIPLNYTCQANEAWSVATSTFYIPEPDIFYLRITAPEGYWIDDFCIQEGNEGEGQEVVYKMGGDDGHEIGYVYFQDDFSWVTSIYGGTDYIADFATAETYWNGITAASVGQEGYDKLIGTGWKTTTNKLKERTYLRLGYLKMGRGANAAGCGGGLITPPIPIKKNCAATLKVSFDCCNYASTAGNMDPTTSMMVRLEGPGTINDNATTETIFPMSTSEQTKKIWLSGSPTKNPWERKELIVHGATSATQIVFESVADKTANRWFFDNVKVEKVEPGSELDPQLVALATTTVTADDEAATTTSVKFKWTAVENAASYEYDYTCSYCGSHVESRSGTTTATQIEFKELLETTIANLRVRALPAEGSKIHTAAEWSEFAEAKTRVESTTVPDSHEVGFEFLKEEFSWVTLALFGQESFVEKFPSTVAGIGITDAKLSDAAKAAVATSGWTQVTAKTYVYEGCFKLGTASATSTVSTPAITTIDANAQVNARITVGGTAFLGTNSVQDDDKVAIEIVGDGTFADGSKRIDYSLGAWNDWVRHSFVAMGISNKTKFQLSNRTAARGRVMFNYFDVVKLADDYTPESELPQFATPTNVTISNPTAYGFEAAWTAVPDATDYTYYLVRPNGTIAATGKTWEPRLHIGGLDGKALDKYNYFFLRVEANKLNLDATQKPIVVPRSSSSSAAVKATMAASSATVYFQDDFSWTINPASPLLQASTDWINSYCTADKMNRFDVLVNEGIVTTNGWSYENAAKAVYTRPGYLHINSSSALGNLISPKITALTAPSNWLVSFDATYFYQYYSKKADTNKSLTVKLKGSGTIEGATNGTLTLTLSRGNAWQGFALRITGADATTQVVLAPTVAASNRVQFDNFRIESAD